MTNHARRWNSFIDVTYVYVNSLRKLEQNLIPFQVTRVLQGRMILKIIWGHTQKREQHVI